LPLAQRVLGPLLIVMVAAVVYALAGFQGSISRDNAIYMYGGQRFAEGVPPYFGVFDRKGPLSQMLPGVGVLLAKALGTDDLLTTRILFFIISCLTVGAVYLLGAQLFGSRRAGLFAAATFLGFGHFTWRAGSGPEVKSAVVLFAVLCLLFAGLKRWGWAGAVGALAALIWQPAGIFLFVVLIVAASQRASVRRSAILRALAGMGTPLLAVVVYFAAHGALFEFLDATLLFGFRYLEQEYPSPLTPLANMIRLGSTYLRTALAPILIGLAMIGTLATSRLREYRSGQRAVADDPLAPLLFSFPLVVVWSLVDFGGASDFYWLLPYPALGFGRVLDLAMTAVESAREAAAARLLTVGAAAALLALGVLTALSVRETGLAQERVFAASIERRFSKDVRVLTIGVPEILVLLHRVNPTRHLMLHHGFVRRVQATTPGGLEG
jgi:hypothetical protein